MDKASLDKALIIESSDIELSGKLSAAAHHGAKFRLLLSMLEQDTLLRPAIADREDQPDIATDFIDDLYPKSSLAASDNDFQYLHTTSQLLHGNSKDALLWQCMHPSPLSLHNDPSLIDDTILANCSLQAQQRSKKSTQKINSEFEQDPTLLNEVIQKSQEQTLHFM